MAPADAPQRPILMATVGAPHGVRGAVKLTVYAADPLGLKRYNPFETGEGARLKLTKVRLIGKSIVGEFEGIADRNAAEALRGAELHVPRQRLPRPDADEFYHVDLIGLEARTVGGELLGTVRAVSDFGAGDLLEIDGENSILVPFTRAVVPEIDFDAGTLTIDPPPGLLEDGDADDAHPDDAQLDDGGPDSA